MAHCDARLAIQIDSHPPFHPKRMPWIGDNPASSANPEPDMWHWLASVSVLMVLSACTTPPPVAEAPAVETAQPPPEPRPARPARAPAAPKAKKPAPIPTRALNLLAECRFRDETGYNGEMKLAVEEARVSAFAATVNIPRRGSCRFDLKNFRQTRELPNVELSHLSDRCVVRVWEQGERVTVAFQQCQKMCTGEAWVHLWPILADRRDGSCA